jgi:hypothetical protein
MLFAYGFGAGDDDIEFRPDVIAAAHKWAPIYGLPVAWVLATIWTESRGNPKAVGDYHVDPRGASIGLMQVNTVASAAALRKARTTREMLFIPDVNVKWGAMILQRKLQLVKEALSRARNKRVANAVAANPALLGELTRLLYTGVDVIRHIYNGTLPDPKKVAHTVNNWRRNLFAVAPHVSETVAMAPGVGPV